MKIINIVREVDTQDIQVKPDGILPPGITPLWRILPDSALLKGKNPFFIPDFPGQITAKPVIAIRISKLGKSIPERFALTHFDGFAIGFLFQAEEYAEMLRGANLPDSPAYIFDKSLILGDFIENSLPDSFSAEVNLRDLGKEHKKYIETIFRFEDNEARVSRAIAVVSRNNTLKTGDLFLIDSSGAPISLHIDSRLAIDNLSFLENKQYLAFNIK